MPRSLHERQRPVLRARRARGRRGRRTAAQFTQDPRRGLAPRHPRADARNRAVRHARIDGRREESADRRLRHVGAVHGSRCCDRHSPRPAGAARAMDRRARRHDRTRRPHFGIWPRAARRSGARGPALRAPPAAAASRCRQRHRRQRHPDALRPPRPRDARDGIHRDPREPPARGNAADAARDRHAPASGSELRRRDPRGHHAGVRPRRGRARPRDHPEQHQPSRNPSR